MKLNELTELVDIQLAKESKKEMSKWLQDRRQNYNYSTFGTCECGQPAIDEYHPCCSYLCSHKKIEQEEKINR